MPRASPCRAQGVGPLSLPLSYEQVGQLRGVAAQAPCGRGSATLLDRSVRRSWQVEPSQVHVANHETWGAVMAQTARLAACGLGLPPDEMQVPPRTP